MELNVIKVERDNDREFVVIKVTKDCNLWPYIIFDTTFEGSDVSNLNRHSFIFPNQNVKANDYVLLFSGRGDDNSYPNRAGGTTWEFYWGLDVNVWNTDGDEILLVKMEEFKRIPC